MSRDAPCAIVTGAGAPTAVSCIMALRLSPLAPRIVACDAEAFSVGLYRSDAGYTVPRADTDPDGFVERLCRIALREGADVVVPGSEIEMKLLAARAVEIRERGGATVALNDARWVRIFTDKWSTVRELERLGIGAPASVLPHRDALELDDFVATYGFPLIVKPRFGSGSRNLFRPTDREELDFLVRYVPEPVVQEYLKPDDEEYTVGVYRSSADDFVASCVLKRSLAGGLTYKAQSVIDPEISALCHAFATSLPLWGPFNVQLRRTRAGLRVFEINLRPSSSVSMRAHFGFNELDLLLRDVLGLHPLPRPEIRRGGALRYWDEIFVDEGDIGGFPSADDAGAVPDSIKPSLL